MTCTFKIGDIVKQHPNARVLGFPYKYHIPRIDGPSFETSEKLFLKIKSIDRQIDDRGDEIVTLTFENMIGKYYWFTFENATPIEIIQWRLRR